MKFAFRYSFARSTHAPNPARRFIQQNQNARLATVACEQKFPNARFAQRRAQKSIWNKSATSAAARGIQKSFFYHRFGRPTSTKPTKWRKGSRSHKQICITPQFWASDNHEVTKRLLPQHVKFAFHQTFERPTSTKWQEGWFGTCKICIFHHSFERPTPTKWREGCFGKKNCILPQLCASDDHEVTRGLSPGFGQPNLPCVKKE